MIVNYNTALNSNLNGDLKSTYVFILEEKNDFFDLYIEQILEVLPKYVCFIGNEADYYHEIFEEIESFENTKKEELDRKNINSLSFENIEDCLNMILHLENVFPIYLLDDSGRYKEDIVKIINKINLKLDLNIKFN